MEASQPRIIFIHGIMPRSGTHFLSNLISHHPDCEKSVIPEDGLLERSAILAKFVNRNYERWLTEGGLPDIPARELLMESLGDGLLKFLYSAWQTVKTKQDAPTSVIPKFLVAKTPQVANISRFYQLFPHEKLLIIVRDGRALVESIELSFGYGREEAMRDWAQSARRIQAFVQACQEAKKPYMLVKFEELHTDTEKQVQKILAFLELDSNKYDFKSALNIPVVGSSVFKGGANTLHWDPVQKTNEFDPLSRASNWNKQQHQRFNWLAAKELSLFDYQLLYFTNANSGLQLRNRWLDFVYNTGLWFRRLKKFTAFIIDRMRRHLRSNNP